MAGDLSYCGGNGLARGEADRDDNDEQTQPEQHAKPALAPAGILLASPFLGGHLFLNDRSV